MPAKVIDLTDQRFGKLVVTKQGASDDRCQTRWWVKCDCGNTSIVAAMGLKSGNVISCGCLRKQIQARYVKRLAIANLTSIRFKSGAESNRVRKPK